MDALRSNPQKLKGACLYFVKLDEADQIQFAGKPYCTICSKIALDSGISQFVLWHASGTTIYDTEEYNRLSFAYDGE